MRDVANHLPGARRALHVPGARRALYAVLGAAVLVTGAGCSDSQFVDPPTTKENPVHDGMTVEEPRTSMDATLAEVRVVAEETLGPDGWEQSPASGGVTACDVGLYRYNAPQIGMTTVMNDDQWWQAWPRIREIIERHGYTDGSEIPMEGSAYHLLRIRNERGDKITIANVEGSGFTYGGQTACYPRGAGDQPG